MGLYRSMDPEYVGSEGSHVQHSKTMTLGGHFTDLKLDSIDKYRKEKLDLVKTLKIKKSTSVKKTKKSILKCTTPYGDQYEYHDEEKYAEVFQKMVETSRFELYGVCGM